MTGGGQDRVRPVWETRRANPRPAALDLAEAAAAGNAGPSVSGLERAWVSERREHVLHAADLDRLVGGDLAGQAVALRLHAAA